MLPQREAFFLPVGTAGERFCLFTYPHAQVRSALLYVHPFAEEMNKSRRMVTLATRGFVEHGWAVLQIDLGGCGDSSGDFGDASWHGWLDDVAAAWCWLRERCDVPVCLWSLRSGALLITDWLKAVDHAPPLLFWQPVTSGRQQLNQFLRVRMAGRILAEGNVRSATKSLQSEFEEGRSVEVGGYVISPALAAGMHAATLALPDKYAAPVKALEVTMAERCEVSPAVAALTAKWKDEGIAATCDAVRGPAFWQTQEIEVCPELVMASVTFLSELRH